MTTPIKDTQMKGKKLKTISQITIKKNKGEANMMMYHGKGKIPHRIGLPCKLCSESIKHVDDYLKSLKP